MPANRVSNTAKALKGTARPCRVNPNEASAPPGMPAINPALLSPLALELLPDLAKPLLDRGVLSQGDGLALAAFAQAVADGVEARRQIAADGGESQRTENAAGKIRITVHPLVAVRDQADRRVAHWSKVFGATPQSRLSAPIATENLPKEINPFEELDNL